ncbi:hypothetical protein J6590_047894 [Homalodisca vitripennis]|nr:hypothetical protein J6590_047894 [Homalodisca vitripennis]
MAGIGTSVSPCKTLTRRSSLFPKSVVPPRGGDPTLTHRLRSRLRERPEVKDYGWPDGTDIPTVLLSATATCRSSSSHYRPDQGTISPSPLPQRAVRMLQNAARGANDLTGLTKSFLSSSPGITNRLFGSKRKQI